MGVYKVIEDLGGQEVILEELFSGKRYKGKLGNEHSIRIGELWLIRLVAPIEKDYYTIFNSPYVLASEEEEWRRFFEINIAPGESKDRREEVYGRMMKRGIGIKKEYYWLEYILQGYLFHTDMVIILAGVPDLGYTRPHFENNGILPERKTKR